MESGRRFKGMWLAKVLYPLGVSLRHGGSRNFSANDNTFCEEVPCALPRLTDSSNQLLSSGASMQKIWILRHERRMSRPSQVPTHPPLRGAPSSRRGPGSKGLS
ncbi:hypothetical protein KC349_g35 [Hortaea werneckii]|nr:hypothetical protein KC349_g35 [Hortaea werneckii]